MATIKQIKDSNGGVHDIIDTKNTAGSTNSSEKLFLIGAKIQGTNPETYSHDTVYVDTDGCLYSNSKKVITEVSAVAGTNINTVGTPTVTASNSTDGKTTLTFNYLKGAKGDTGAAGSNGADGKSVKDVVCVTTSGGTTTGTPSTADGGTTYYRVKDTNNGWLTGTIAVKNGSKGSTGEKGDKGDDGTSVTITSVSQNTTAGGTSTVTFSDGNTLSIKNGSNGTNATTTSIATTSANGLMSSTDKTKLDGIATGAEVNVQSDWYVTDSSSDAFIKNKPQNIITGKGDGQCIAVFDNENTLTAGPEFHPDLADKFLTGGGAWRDIPTYAGATSTTDGVPGLVPSCPTRNKDGFLKGDGTWSLPTDTKNTAGSTNSSEKLFLIGAKTQGTNPETYSHDTAYIDTDGCLYSKSEKVITTTDIVTDNSNGIMTYDDKNKLDRIQDYYIVYVDTNRWIDGEIGSLNSIRCFDYNISEFNFKIGDKIRLMSNNNFPQDQSVTQSTYNIGTNIVVTNPTSDFSFTIIPDTTNIYGNAITQNINLWALSKYGGYIDIIVTVPHIDDGVGCKCIPLYNNMFGFNSYYANTATNATNADNATNVNIPTYTTNTSCPVLFTTSVTSGNKRIYTDSVSSSFNYNPSTNVLTVASANITTASVSTAKITTANVNTIAHTTSGSTIVFNDTVSLKDYTYVNGRINCKGTDHQNSGITLNGGTTSSAPTIDVFPSNTSKNKGITLNGGTTSSAPTIDVFATNTSTSKGIVLTGRNGSTAAKIVVYSGTGTTCTITGGSTSISSDERLKDFTNDIDIDFEKLKQIPKKYFTWKRDDEKILNIGTSAQALENIYPEIVEEYLNEDEGKYYKSVDYSKLSIVALAAIDKLNERIVELENKIKDLEQK